MADSQLNVVITANMSQFNSAMSQMQSSLRNTASQVSGTMSEAEGSTSKGSSKIGSALKGVGLAVAGAFAIDKIKDFGVAMVNASADAQAMNAQFSSVFGEFEGKAQASIDSISKESGVLGNRMKETFTKMSSFAKVSGMDTADALNLGDRAMRAIADSSAFYDRSLEDVGESLQSFLKGNYENDAALGLSATETTRNSKANELYGKSFNDLSESQKQLTLLQMVEDANKLSGAFGQASREQDGLTNVTGNLKQAWTDLLAIMGKPVLAMVIPIMKGMTTVLVAVTEKVKSFGQSFESMKGVSDTFANVVDRIRGAFAIGNFSSLTNLIPQLVEILLGGIPRLLTLGSEMINNIASGMGMSIPQLIAMPVQIMAGILQAFITALPSIIFTGFQIIQGLINGIVTAIPQLVSMFTNIIGSVVTTFTTMLPTILNMGVNLLLQLVNGILTALPTLIAQIGTLVTTIVTTLVTFFTTNLPLVIQAGLSLLQGLITGLVQNLPIILTAVITLLNGLVTAIMTNLPLIITAGIQILNSLIDGIIQLLPSLITTALQLIDMIVNALVQNLPLIITAGIQLLVALVNGVVKAIPKLIPMVYGLIMKITGTILANLPLIIGAGVQILMAVINGIIKMIPTLIATIPKIVKSIFQAFAGVDWGKIGKDIMKGLGQGIKNSATAIFGTVSQIAKGLLKAGKKALGIGSPSKLFADEIGKMIPEGIAVGIKANNDVTKSAIGDVSNSMVSNAKDYTVSGLTRNNPTVASANASASGTAGDLIIPVTIEMNGAEFIKTTIRLTQQYLADLTRKQNRLNGQYA